MPRSTLSYSRLAVLVVVVSMILGACKSAPEPREDDETTTAQQTVTKRSIELRFVVAATIAGDLETPIAGQMRGAIFRTSDVGPLGPKKGAEAVVKMEPRQVDLSTDESPTWTTPELEPGQYTFLGFVDLDENSPDEPDDGDIVTRPPTNRFDISEVGSTIFGRAPASLPPQSPRNMYKSPSCQNAAPI